MRFLKIKKMFLIIICTFTFTFFCAATEKIPAKEIELLPGAIVALPDKSKVTFEWLLSPLNTENTEKIERKNEVFSVGLKDEAWIGSDNQLFYNTKDKIVVKLEVPYSDFLVLDDGSMFIAADKYLGFVPKPGKKTFRDEEGTVVVPFQPLCRLPAAECRLFKGQSDVFYIAGKNEKDFNEEVYSFGGEGTVKEIRNNKSVLSYKKVFTINQHITSVAGDGKNTYVAMERLIGKITRGKEKIEGIFVHPSKEITGIAYSKEAGLFYATDSGIGYTGSNGGLEFIRINGPRIVIRGGILYVFLPEIFGALKISNVEEFKTYNLNSKSKSGDKK